MNSRLLLLGLAAAALLPAQPQIKSGGIVNAASYFAVNGGLNTIARGSYFVIFGKGLGPANIVVAPSLPFGTQLGGANGTKVTFAVGPGGARFDAFMYYAVDTQVAGILPSNVPEADAAVTVTYNGQTSQAERVFVTKASPGIFTRNQAGSGLAKAQVYRTATDVFEPVLATAANPGQNVVLYGTGLGPIQGPDNVAPGAVAMADPVMVFVNGVGVKPDYAGRSPQYPGLDQINFVLPASLTPGCYTNVVVSVGGWSSNRVAIPTAASGAVCPHPYGLSAASLAKLDDGGSVNIGGILMASGVSLGGAPVDAALAAFFTANADGVYASTGSITQPNQSPQPVAPGQCAIWDLWNGPKQSGNSPFIPDWGKEISAGDKMTLTSPDGKSFDMTSGAAVGLGGGYFAQGPVGTFAAGTWTFRANGGDIGSFSTTVTVPAPLAWIGPPKDNATMSRGDMTISWNGGAPMVAVAGSASSPDTGKAFTCGFAQSGGKGTVPAAVLGLLPPAGGQLAVLSSANSTFTLPGKLDGGLAIVSAGEGHQVSWR